MRKITSYTILLALMFAAASCDKHEVVFDEPFFFITDRSGAGSSVLDSRSITEETYVVKLSSRSLDEPVTLRCEIVVGSGLTEGVDYELLSPLTMVFPGGLYENFIRIQWLANLVDPDKDNTLTIRLADNSAGFTIGFPGPDAKNSTYVVKKENRD